MGVLCCVSQTAEMTAAGREGPTLNTNGPTTYTAYKVKQPVLTHGPADQRMLIKAVRQIEMTHCTTRENTSSLHGTLRSIFTHTFRNKKIQ